MKKVLFVINTMGCAGAEKALLELLKKFTPDQYEVSLYVLLGQGELIHQVPEYVRILNTNYCDVSVLDKEGKRQLIKNIIKDMFVHASILKNFPYVMKNLMRMIKEKRIFVDKLLWKVMADGAKEQNETYDLAVAFLEGGSTYYVANHVRAKKKVAYLHVDYQYAGYHRALDGDCYRVFDRIFVVSKEVKDSFYKAYPEYEEKTMVCHNLVNQDEIRRKACMDGGFEDAYDGLRLLTVGRLTAQKAYEISIEAMRLLKEKGIRARWYVLGEGELRKKLEEKIATCGLEDSFLLLGTRENPYPYFQQCDIYVHASRFEGKSIAIQEAQTLGCAVVVSDCSGNREQVTDGVDGLMCHLNAESICEKIEQLVENQEMRELLGKTAAKKKTAGEEDLPKLLSLLQD